MKSLESYGKFLELQQKYIEMKIKTRSLIISEQEQKATLLLIILTANLYIKVK